MSQTVTLKVIDQENVETVVVPIEFVNACETLKDNIEDAGDDGELPIPMSRKIFDKVFAFWKLFPDMKFPVKCMCGKGNADYGLPTEKPMHCIDCREKHKYKGAGLINITKETKLTDVETEYCALDAVTLTDLMKAADFLAYPRLLHVTAKYLADFIANNKSDIVRKYFGFDKPFTEEDYKRVEDENPWMYDNLKTK